MDAYDNFYRNQRVGGIPSGAATPLSIAGGLESLGTSISEAMKRREMNTALGAMQGAEPGAQVQRPEGVSPSGWEAAQGLHGKTLMEQITRDKATNEAKMAALKAKNEERNDRYTTAMMISTVNNDPNVLLGAVSQDDPRYHHVAVPAGNGKFKLFVRDKETGDEKPFNPYEDGRDELDVPEILESYAKPMFGGVQGAANWLKERGRINAINPETVKRTASGHYTGMTYGGKSRSLTQEEAQNVPISVAQQGKETKVVGDGAMMVEHDPATGETKTLSENIKDSKGGSGSGSEKEDQDLKALHEAARDYAGGMVDPTTGEVQKHPDPKLAARIFEFGKYMMDYEGLKGRDAANKAYDLIQEMRQAAEAAYENGIKNNPQNFEKIDRDRFIQSKVAMSERNYRSQFGGGRQAMAPAGGGGGDEFRDPGLVQQATGQAPAGGEKKKPSKEALEKAGGERSDQKAAATPHIKKGMDELVNKYTGSGGGGEPNYGKGEPLGGGFSGVSRALPPGYDDPRSRPAAVPGKGTGLDIYINSLEDRSRSSQDIEKPQGWPGVQVVNPGAMAR